MNSLKTQNISSTISEGGEVLALKKREEKLFDTIMIPALEIAFEDVLVLKTPYSELSYSGITLNKHFTSFNRKHNKFNEFYQEFKQIVLPKTHNRDILKDILLVCVKVTSEAQKNKHYHAMSCHSTKYDLTFFEISQIKLSEILNGLNSFNIQNIKKLEDLTCNKTKSRKAIKMKIGG